MGPLYRRPGPRPGPPFGGIATLDAVIGFPVAGAAAVRVGTANFYDPTASARTAAALPAALTEFGSDRVTDVVGTLRIG